MFYSEDKAKKTVIPLSCQKTVSNEKKVSAVAKSVKSNKHMENLFKACTLAGYVLKILSGNLYMRKLSAMWIPQKLTDV